MFKIVLVAALAALAVDARFLSRVPQLNGRIIGGHDANIEDYPYHVSFQRFDVHGCGGSIIAPVRNIILTAGHCTDPYVPDATMMSVRYGSSLRNQGGSVINVSEVFQHPSYNPNTQDYDISLLKLYENVLLSPQVRPIFLVSSDVQEGGRSAEVTGWGRVSENGPLSKQLQVVELQEVDRDACIDVYGPQITERMICFTGAGKSACTYDSGGALVSRNGLVTNQIGIASWGSECGIRGRPGVYTNIHSRDIIDYIAPIIVNHGTD